jgi:FKBP-type peptidyl-prolyl cis-trans isomerase 2
MKAEKGKKVTIEYTGTLEDGTVFDASEKHGKPLEFVLGSGMVIPGFEKAVEGMEKGEEKEVTIKPDEGYGNPNPEMVKKVPKEQFPKDKEIKPGMMLALGLPTGQQVPARIKEVDDKEVTIDLNHPLAGKTLKFKIKLVEVSEADKAEHSEGCGCGEEH